ncbi:MTH1187 family thiamine-binding protein [Salipaludibacillus sp. CF4.18]|uniref:MTH1187 family thiamine-binding protein n=1 Tax=Salipaludibacillus sp. CF4.18 TaxID=3373081 RepID=UPI003EE66A3C
MVKGLSFQKGIIFIGNKYIACSYDHKEKIVTWIKPASPKNMLYISWLVFKAMPVWYHICFFLWGLLIILPYVMNAFEMERVYGLPVYSLIYFLLGTHFWFPKELKKYHGAEHKVFSYNGVISVRKRKEITEETITNRFCSTNGILLFFLLVPCLTVGLRLISVPDVLQWGTVLALFVFPFATYWLNRTRETKVHRFFLKMSYWLQRNITTEQPEEKHVKTAIRSYRRLAMKEFPGKLRLRKMKKGDKKMAIADVTIMPLGSKSTSMSDVVAKIQQLLEETSLPIKYELTSMSTIIEGETKDIFQILQEIQEVPFSMGHQRVAVNIRIDERRDKPSSMQGKIASVNEKREE